jgi:hypothetical protein
MLASMYKALVSTPNTKNEKKKNTKRVMLPGAICILHPDSCCMREICSPPLPITSQKKKKQKKKKKKNLVEG